MISTRMAKLGIACSLIWVLAACGPADNEPGPGGVTVGEARALDEAAEMLDTRKSGPAETVSSRGRDEAD